MGETVGRRKRGWRGAWLACAALLLAAQTGAARADAAPSSDAARVRSTIAALLHGRRFVPEEGCQDKAACRALLARLDAGDFSVIVPVERSDHPDMPLLRRERRRCPRVDPVRIVAHFRAYVATRGFAVYRIELPERGRRHEEVLVFRAEHYVSLEALRRGDARGQTALSPGSYVAMSLRGCRLLATARAEDGDWLAKHNVIGDADHASELLKMNGSYYVLNLAPIAGPDQPKKSWWYTLELWDLGPRLDADRIHQKHVYAFGYRPGAAPVGASGATRSEPPG